MDAKEMEQLLREGAYAVLLQDNEDEIREFFDEDIDKILEKRAHVLVTESGGGQSSESWLNTKKKSKARYIDHDGGHNYLIIIIIII